MPEPTVAAILALVDAAPRDATAAVRLDRSGAESVQVLAAEVRALREQLDLWRRYVILAVLQAGGEVRLARRVLIEHDPADYTLSVVVGWGDERIIRARRTDASPAPTEDECGD